MEEIIREHISDNLWLQKYQLFSSQQQAKLEKDNLIYEPDNTIFKVPKLTFGG